MLNGRRVRERQLCNMQSMSSNAPAGSRWPVSSQQLAPRARRYVWRAALPVGQDCTGSPDPEEHIGDEHVFLVASVQAVGHILMVDDECPLPGEGLHAQEMSAPG